MIKRSIISITLILVTVFLYFTAKHSIGGDNAMVAQVESQVAAISYQKPVLIKNIYVSPGQVVDSGDILVEVERPDLALDMEKKINEKTRLERKINEALEIYFNSLMIINTNYDRKIKLLTSEKEELEYQLRLRDNQKIKFGEVSSLTYLPQDSLKLLQLDVVSEQLAGYHHELKLEESRLARTLQYDTSYYNSDLSIIRKEIVTLEDENKKLVKRAHKQGTVGNVNVQLNELVPPYKTLLNIYDLNPSLIKAFVQERRVKNIKTGSKVKVESVNREYSIAGEIVEIGSRITSYPEKINPLVKQKSYGQEIFISISENNNFLNGEKVFVYVIED